MAERFTPEQQRILDAIDTYGYVRCHTDWRSGRRHITTGRGQSFNVRSFLALVERGVIGINTAEPQYSHAGVQYVRRDGSK